MCYSHVAAGNGEFPRDEQRRQARRASVRILPFPRICRAAAVVLALSGLNFATFARADSRPAVSALAPLAPALGYADLADLADAAPLVIRVSPRKIARLEAALYIEAKTEALVAGQASLGEVLRYLVDVPLDPKGKLPALKKKSVVVFARLGRPGELQLVFPDAQLIWDPALDVRLRGILGELLTPGAPQRITGVREAIHVAGNLAGEGETQLFLATANEEPSAITVNRSPGQPPRWSVSFSEVLEQSGRVPQRDTLAWYRLACFLAPELPAGTTVSGSADDRALAAADYRYVLDQLGTCPRTRR
jgi:hypothetical protein